MTTRFLLRLARMIDARPGKVAVAFLLAAVASGERVVELAASLSALGLHLGESIHLVLLLTRDGVLVEALPESETLTLSLKPLI